MLKTVLSGRQSRGQLAAADIPFHSAGPQAPVLDADPFLLYIVPLARSI